MFSQSEIENFIKNLKLLNESSSKKAKKILQRILEVVLERTGHSFVKLSEENNSCFDIVAKKQNQLTLIKIEPYIDSFDKQNSEELKNLSYFLNASPIIIGVRGRRFDEIQDGLVLFRYGIPVISPETFLNLLIDGLPPLVYCNRGGYFVEINRNILHQARKEKNLSYNELARKIGVSRRTIYEYENSINPPPEIVLELEDVLDVSLAQGIKIYDLEIERKTIPSISRENLTPLKDEIAELLTQLGIFSQFWVEKTPFDAYGEHQDKNYHSGLNVLLCVDEGDEDEIIRKVKTTSKIASLTKRRTVMIAEEEDSPISKHVPTFTINELREMKKAFELVKKWMKKYAKLKENLH